MKKITLFTIGLIFSQAGFSKTLIDCDGNKLNMESSYEYSLTIEHPGTLYFLESKQVIKDAKEVTLKLSRDRSGLVGHFENAALNIFPQVRNGKMLAQIYKFDGEVVDLELYNCSGKFEY